MKRFTRIVIALLLIAITRIDAKPRGYVIRQISPLEIVITAENNDNPEVYKLSKEVLRDWNTYHYVKGKKGRSAIVSDYASEVFFTQGDSLIREGWPEHHYALQHSAYCFGGNRLYGFGGYGYWNSKNILRYWSSEEGWIPILTLNNYPALVPGHNSILLIRDSVALVFGGETTDTRNPFLRNDLNLIQKVDLNKRSVQHLQINYALNQDNFLFENDSVAVFKVAGELLYFDLRELIVRGTIITEEVDQVVKKFEKDSKYEDQLLEFMRSGTTFRLNEETEEAYGLIMLLVAVAVLSFVILFIIRKTKTRSLNLVLSEKDIRMGANYYTFSPEEHKIMEFLKMNGSAIASDINELFSTDLSLSHKNKLRSAAIKNINSQCRTVAGQKIGEVIKSRKAEKDSRMTEYYLNQDLFN